MKKKRLKTPYKKITENDRNNSNRIDVKEYKSLLGSIILYCSKVKTGHNIMFAINEALRI